MSVLVLPEPTRQCALKSLFITQFTPLSSLTLYVGLLVVSLYLWFRFSFLVTSFLVFFINILDLSPPRLPFLVLIRHKYSNTATSFLSPPHLHSPLLVQVGAVSLIPRMIELLASAHLFCKYKSTLGRITSPPIINNTRCFSSVIPIVLVQIISLALVRWSSNL